MPTPKEHLDRGELEAAIDALTREVKANPADASRRTFLFELLSFAGQWDRAEKQVDVLGGESAPAGLAVQVYKSILSAERQRERLFSEGVAPHFLNEPPPWVDVQIEGVSRLGRGDVSGARELLDRAEEQRPAVTGRFNGQPFTDFRDYDDRVGGVLELIVKDRYAWLPFEQIRRIEIRPPSKLRDLLWVPTRIEAVDGTIGEVFVPALYSGSSRNENDLVRLGRMTDWKPVAEDLQVASGLRLLIAGEEDFPILEVRSIEFDTAAREAPVS